ncbi:ABC transporter substrate-binding protein, partial [Nitrospinota bacterium]
CHWEGETMKRRWIIGLALAVSCLWIAGGAAAAPKGKLVLGLSAAPPTLDPHPITGFPLHNVYPLMFDFLVFRDHDGKIIPHLAKSWRMVEPKVWEFKLREGMKFTNGEPVDAHAVKFSLERIVDPKLKSRQWGMFRSIHHVEVVDRYTARVHTKYPDTFLISMLTNYGAIVPPKYYKSHSRKHLARNPVGSGPYRLVKWKKGERLVFEANPNYWKPGVPRIKTGIIRIIPEPTTRVSALVAGDVDAINNVPPQLVSMVKANPKYRLVTGPSGRTCSVIMIVKPGAPWYDARVRKALNYAVDKKAILRHVLRGNGRIISTNVGPNSYGSDPALKPYPYDPARAKKLLAEAGYPNGFDVDFIVPLGRYIMGKETAEAISGQLEKVGVRAKVSPLEWGAYNRRSRVRWKEGVKAFWTYSCRMDMYLHAEFMYAGQIISRSSRGGFRDKAVDKIINDARSETDDAKRLRKYQKINRLIYEKYVPLIFLYQTDQIHAKNKRIDWKPRPNETVLLFDLGWKD